MKRLPNISPMFHRTYSSLVLGGIEEVDIVIRRRFFDSMFFESIIAYTKSPKKAFKNDQTVSVGHHCYRETILASEDCKGFAIYVPSSFFYPLTPSDRHTPGLAGQFSCQNRRWGLSNTIFLTDYFRHFCIFEFGTMQ
jgi:hypothetical protein